MKMCCAMKKELARLEKLLGPEPGKYRGKARKGEPLGRMMGRVTGTKLPAKRVKDEGISGRDFFKYAGK